MTERIQCCVPFCRRTTKNEKKFSEWICGPHYRPVDPVVKALRRKAKRQQNWQLDNLLWKNAKKQAIERAAGI